MIAALSAPISCQLVMFGYIDLQILIFQDALKEYASVSTQELTTSSQHGKATRSHGKVSTHIFGS